MKSFVVALWESRIAVSSVAELIIDADTPLDAAILAMEKYSVAAMPVIVVMSEQEQTTFFDMEWMAREQRLFYSKTETWPRTAEGPLFPAEQYNREMDERNKLLYDNRDKPWLPGYDE